MPICNLLASSGDGQTIAQEGGSHSTCLQPTQKCFLDLVSSKGMGHASGISSFCICAYVGELKWSQNLTEGKLT